MMFDIAHTTRNRLGKSIVLLIGFCWGCSWFWIRGGAFDLNSSPEGYSWSRYLLSGWAAEHNPRLFNNYREPLYFWLLGMGGEELDSYRNAAVYISSVSSLIMLISVGFIAHTFGGAWVGSAAMIVFPWVATHVDATRWLNNYPMQGAWVGMMLATSIGVATSKKGVFRVFFLGILLTMGVWLDQRMMIFIPICFVLGLWGIGRRHSWFVAVLFGIGLWYGYVFGSRTERRAKIPTTLEKMELQRDVVRRFQKFRGLQPICQKLDDSELLSISALGTHCSYATLKDNVEYRLKQNQVYGMWGWWAIGLCCLIGLAHHAAVFRILCLGSVLPCLVWMSWTPFPDRYTLLLAVPISALSTVAMSGGAFGKQFPMLKGLWVVGLLYWVWNQDFSDRYRISDLKNNQDQQRVSRIIEELDIQLSPLDLFMDCSRSGIESAFLPRQNHAQLTVQNKQEGEACPTFVQETATQTRWLLKGDDDRVYPQHNGWEVHRRWSNIVLWKKIPQ